MMEIRKFRVSQDELQCKEALEILQLSSAPLVLHVSISHNNLLGIAITISCALSKGSTMAHEGQLWE